MNNTNNILVSLLLFAVHASDALAEQQLQIPSAITPVESESDLFKESSPLTTERGLLMFDYEKVPLDGGGMIDLLGAHYLHQLSDSFYLGIGLAGPMVDGEYGGFFVLDTTLHAQKKIFGNMFIDAGLSLGGGAGGTSIEQSKELSGTGGYTKGYVGLGYEFSDFNAGVNYSHVKLTDSVIDHSQLNFYIQMPISFSVSSFANSGRKFRPRMPFSSDTENMLSLEFNNIHQISPTGTYRGSFETVSPQLAHFFTKNNYVFFGFEVGYKGIRWYNQVQGGVGHRVAVSSKVNLYGQLGIGSGGYGKEIIDTGPGLLIYPKVSAEYMLSSRLGVSLSSGYLMAPEGTAKNITLGASMNYHLSTPGRRGGENDWFLRGLRVNVFPQVLFDIDLGGEEHHNINMLSLQFDYNLSDYVYIPFQLSAAANDIYGYPGYVELLAGLGLQTKYSTEKSTQEFLQVMIGENVNGGILKAAVGMNYSLNEKFAVYGQLGKTISLNEYITPEYDVNFTNNYIGLGLTYRFSVPSR